MLDHVPLDGDIPDQSAGCPRISGMISSNWLVLQKGTLGSGCRKSNFWDDREHADVRVYP